METLVAEIVGIDTKAQTLTLLNADGTQWKKPYHYRDEFGKEEEDRMVERMKAGWKTLAFGTFSRGKFLHLEALAW